MRPVIITLSIIASLAAGILAGYGLTFCFGQRAGKPLQSEQNLLPFAKHRRAGLCSLAAPAVPQAG